MLKFFITILLLFICNPAFASINNFTPTDNIILSTSPTTNFSTNTSFTFSNNGANAAYIMNYNLTSIAGQTPLHAYLNVWMQRGFQHSLNIYRVLQNFNAAQSNWNQYATGVNWASAGALTSGTDFTTTNSSTYTLQNPGAYVQVDLTALVTDCLGAGNNCSILMRWGSGGGFFDTIDMSHNATNPPFLTVSTGTPGVPNLWYVRDGGGTIGTDSTHCNGTANVVFTGSNGPNCAVNNPVYITGNGSTIAAQWIGGDIMNIDGDSDISYAFTVSGVTTTPKEGDTYTNNGITYTVTVPLPAGKSSGTLSLSGVGVPTSSGTLTKNACANACDTTITFSAEGSSQAIYKITSQMTIPGGIPGQQTKIIGTGSHWPQLWLFSLFEAIIDTNDYIDYENLDVTGHDNCIKNGPIGPSVGSVNADGYLNVCNTGGTSNGTQAAFRYGGTGKTYTNLLVHNVGYAFENGVNGGVFGNLTFTNVKIFGNWFQGGLPGGFNGQSQDNVMTGTISLINSMVDFNGCGQRYPLQDTADIFNNISATGLSKSVDNEANFYNCWGQNQVGYGDGWGFGGSNTNAGNFNIIGSSISFNTQDGLDTLHGNANGTITIAKSRFEGNAGQQIKANGHIVDIENSIINADCARWVGAPEASTTYGISNQAGGCPGGNCGFNMYAGDHGFTVCRAQGDGIVFPLSSGSQIYLYGNTINTNGIAIEPGGGSTCDSTTGIHIKNNIVNGGGYAIMDGALVNIGGGPTGREGFPDYIYYDGDSNGNGAGVCGAVGNGSGGVMRADEDYNVVYSMKNNNSGCNGAHDICGTIPGYTTNIPMGTPSGVIGTYYFGTAMASLSQLGASSIARGAGLTTGLVYTQGTNDFNNFTPIALPIVDDGALQYGSNPQSCSGNGIACTINTTCCSGFCVSGFCAQYNCGDTIVTSPETCDTNGPNLNSQTCITQGFSGGTLACTSGCLSFNTASCTGSCTALAGSCSTGATCCSNLCNASACVAQICGDGILPEGNKVCDGSNLNSQTCFTQGFTGGGTLACAGNCLSFNTSGCTQNSSGVSLGIGGSIGGN